MNRQLVHCLREVEGISRQAIVSSSKRISGAVRTLAAAAVLLCIVLPSFSMAQDTGTASNIEKIGFTVTGGDDKLTERLIEASALVAARRNDVEDVQELLAIARNDYGRMIAVLWDAGYLGATVSILADGNEAADLSLVNLPDRVRKFRYIIRTGTPYQFDDLRIAPLDPSTEFPEGFERGQVAALPLIADATDAALDAWADDGHAKANVARQSIVADHARKQVDADVGVAPGPQVTLGQVTLTGNEKVSSDRIFKILGFPTGEVFSPKKVQDSANRLRSTGAFRSVTLTQAEQVNADGSLDYRLQVAEGKPRRIEFGAEYTNREGLEISGRWIHRNIGGGAQRLEIGGRLKNIGRTDRDPSIEFSTRYVIPSVRRADTDFFVQLDLSRLDERDYFGYSAIAAAGYIRNFSDRLKGELAAGFNWSTFDNAFGTDQEKTLAFLRGRGTFDRRDDFTNATRGYYGDLIVEPFLNLNGSANGVRSFVDGRGYFSIDADAANVLAARLQLGSIFGPNLSQMPSNLLFYSGGGGTVRGRAFEDLGVDLPNGLRSGGRSFLGIAGEYRRAVTDVISAVAFYDWGYIGAESFPDGSGSTHAGAGLGVRYLTPIGPLRVDVAVPVGPRESGNSFFLYIGVGQAF